jgi:hypothetical protein
MTTTQTTTQENWAFDRLALLVTALQAYAAGENWGDCFPTGEGPEGEFTGDNNYPTPKDVSYMINCLLSEKQQEEILNH